MKKLSFFFLLLNSFNLFATDELMITGDGNHLIINAEEVIVETSTETIQLLDEIKSLKARLKIQEDEMVVQTKRIDTEEKTTSSMKGTITMWSGEEDQIPEGWLLCNGQNGTPDLRDKFTVGAGNKYSVGNRGGRDYVTLTTSQIPSHSHEVNDPGHRHSMGYDTGSDYDNTLSTIHVNYNGLKVIKTGEEKTKISIKNTGKNQPHENRPPYYALCFIMKK